MNAAVQETELTTSRSIAGLIAGGMIPQPARQPVIAYVLDRPSSTIVRSIIPSTSAIDAGGSSRNDSPR